MEEMEVVSEEKSNEDSCELSSVKEDPQVARIENETENEIETNSDSDSASSQNEDEDDEDADEAEVKRLEAILTQNPYDHNTLSILILKLQRMGELTRLRAARENMSSIYPLSPDVWLSWIRDEIKLATTAEEKAEIVKLCERAVQDYLCKFGSCRRIFSLKISKHRMQQYDKRIVIY